MPQTRLERGGATATESSFHGLKPGPGRSAAEVTLHQRARIDRAIVEVVAERGYEHATVREIAQVAGVSTRTFYQHYSGKEDCFLRVQRRLGRETMRRIGAAAKAGSRDDRLRAATTTILEGWGDDRRDARFLLLGPSGAGRAALRQARLAERALGDELAPLLGHSECGGNGSARLIARGIVAGLAAAARSATLGDRDGVRTQRRDALARWALSCSSPLPLLQAPSTAVRTRPSGAEDPAVPSPGGDADLLLAAAAKLAAAGKYGQLVPRDICAAAGLSRSSFGRCFLGVGDCLATAASRRFEVAVERARLAGAVGSSQADVALRSMAGLCSQIAGDRALASLCFGDLIESGEWSLRRDRSLAASAVGLLEGIGWASKPPAGLEAEATLGALLGLLRGESAGGRPCGGIRRMAPVLAYLALAPLTKIENMGSNHLSGSIPLWEYRDRGRVGVC